MLRVRSHSDKIFLLQKKRVHWSKNSFWSALAIASILHLAALLLFRFSTLKKLYYSTTTAKVETHPISARCSEQNVFLLSQELMPPLSKEPERAPLHPTFFPIEYRAQDIAFERGRQLDIALIPPKKPCQRKSRVHIVAAGDVVASHNCKEYQLDRLYPECCLRYDIRVDCQTGRICWYQLLTKQRGGCEEIAEEIIYHLQFQPKAGQFLAPAVVELHFMERL